MSDGARIGMPGRLQPELRRAGMTTELRFRCSGEECVRSTWHRGLTGAAGVDSPRRPWTAPGTRS